MLEDIPLYLSLDIICSLKLIATLSEDSSHRGTDILCPWTNIGAYFSAQWQLLIIYCNFQILCPVTQSSFMEN